VLQAPRSRNAESAGLHAIAAKSVRHQTGQPVTKPYAAKQQKIASKWRLWEKCYSPKKEKLGDRSAASSASAPTPNSRCIPNAPASPRQLPVTAPSRAHKQILPSDRKFKRELAQPVLRASRCDLVIAVFRCFLKCALLAILLVLVIEWVY
jgi:hypothetical protein